MADRPLDCPDGATTVTQDAETTEDEPVDAGTLLGGKYRIGRLLGRGGWGAVYEAEHEDLHRMVAVKVLEELTPEALERFRTEARATAQLVHPNVVHVADFEAREGARPFLVMERLVGATLAAVLSRDGALPPRRALAIASQMLSALEAAHAAGIVHRDIKPSNVFLLADDVVKLLDFGIAKMAKAKVRTATGVHLGTPAYMAPEQILLEPVDARTDVHAVGACLAEMLTGKRLYAAPDRGALAARILDPHERRVDVGDDALSAIVARAASRTPNDRYPSAAAMREAVDALRAARAAPAPRRPASAPSRIFAVSVAVTLAIGLLVALVAALSWKRPPEVLGLDAASTSASATIEASAAEDVVASSDAASNVDAVDASSPEPGRTAQPARRCVCRGGDGRALCAAPQALSCECVAAGGMHLCATPYVATDASSHECPRETFSGNGLATGGLCKGYAATWAPGRSTDEPATSILRLGELACSVCTQPLLANATPRAACRGVDANGASAVGRVVCDRTTR